MNCQHALLFILLLCLSLLLTLLDYSFGASSSVFSLQIIPFFFATWYIGISSGIFFAIFSSCTEFTEALLLNPHAPFLPFLFAGLLRLAIFSLLLYGSWKIKM